MAPGATTLLLLITTMTGCCIGVKATSDVQQPFGRVLKGVRLNGGYMEVVQEERCSEGILRLTCRSLRAFVFVLEAEYQANRTETCGRDMARLQERKLARMGGKRVKDSRGLKGNYVDDEEEDPDAVDLRLPLNRRCSGQHHCRFNLNSEHPATAHWNPATLRLKYACIPETAVHRYCNEEIKVPNGVGGYLKSPGYPLYYAGGNSCGWTFRSFPGQRIVLTFHDLNIRSPKADGNCIDVVRIRERGKTLFEYCGTTAGVKIVSNSDTITLDLIATAKLYPARGFFLRYQALGCPTVTPPNGSYVSNDTLTSKTFFCKTGTVFPDSRERKRTLECKDGKWNENVLSLPGCIATSAVILKAENEHHQLSSLSGDNVLGGGVRIGRGEDAVAGGNSPVMDSAQSAMMKQADYVVDVVLPTVLIALLFVGNAIIVYIIFQYRKRKLPAPVQAEEMSLRNSNDVPQV